MTHDLTITRLIDAPLDAVWRAWTEQFAQWFVPRPWTVEVIEQDLRPGGRSALIMRGPAGEEHREEGVFLEIVPHARIVLTDAFAAGWTPKGPFMVRIDEFAEEDGLTRYTATARHWTAEARDSHAAMGFEQGWGAAAAQLEEVAKGLEQ